MEKFYIVVDFTLVLHGIYNKVINDNFGIDYECILLSDAVINKYNLNKYKDETLDYIYEKFGKLNSLKLRDIVNSGEHILRIMQIPEVLLIYIQNNMSISNEQIREWFINSFGELL